ncbi:MAG: PilN domain-containing protein [Nitrospirota bacterium]
MIKINLLPSKKKPPKKATDLQKQIVLAILLLIIFVGGMAYYWKYQTDVIADLEQQKRAAESRRQEQEQMLKEVKNVETERDKVKEKIEVVQRLKKNQSGPVRLLDEISRALPLGVNVISLTEANNNINIEGQAFGNHEVVRFIDNLKASPLLSGVNLLETSRAKVEGIDIYKYKLQFVYKGL